MQLHKSIQVNNQTPDTRHSDEGSGICLQVLKGQSYNEKVDVFSFAIIIFELLSGRVAMAAIGDRRELDYEAVRGHAEETSNGFRLPLPVNWPAPVANLIRDCWAQRSSKRPSFAVIEQRLKEIKVTLRKGSAHCAEQ